MARFPQIIISRGPTVTTECTVLKPSFCNKRLHQAFAITFFYTDRSKFHVVAAKNKFSDAQTFVVSGRDGSLTKFTNGAAGLVFNKKIDLQGIYPLVRFINGEIVTAGRFGKLTVLNEKLHILKTFHGTGYGVLSLSADKNFIAFGDWNGVVRYYNRDGGMTPKVRLPSS